jgi:surface carbohydrate biosynthesis protein
MNILLPIETINREIDFKILLGARLSGQGHRIYIGQHDFLMSLLTQLEGGLYIGKNIFHKRSSEENGAKYRKLKEKGFDIIYLHEEGGVFAGNQADWKRILESQYNPAIFNHLDRLCVWGEFQKEYDQTRCRDVPIHVVGHPRFDLYKPWYRSYYREEVDQIQNKYGNYILINGNYSWANHGRGLTDSFPESMKQMDSEERLRRVHYYTYFTKQMVAMIELTHQLAVAFPRLNFVYRPHPSEDHQYYKTVFNGVANIMVNHEGPVNPWILGAKALVHDGCTTAIEASIAGVPVLNYKPFFDPVCDIWLANRMGSKATNLEEVIGFIEELDGEKEDSMGSSDPLAQKLLFNFEGNSFLALESLILKKIEEQEGFNSIYPGKSYIKFRYAQTKSKISVQKILQPKKSRYISYHTTKFYGFGPLSIKAKFGRAEVLLGKELSWTYHNPNLITIDQ